MLWIGLRLPHKPETWSGLSLDFCKNELRTGPLLKFLILSVGGVSTMIEWWFFFESVCFIAGSFGVVSLAVHSIPFNLMPLVFMVPLAIMIGLTVRMGHLIVEFPRYAGN